LASFSTTTVHVNETGRPDADRFDVVFAGELQDCGGYDGLDLGHVVGGCVPVRCGDDRPALIDDAGRDLRATDVHTDGQGSRRHGSHSHGFHWRSRALFGQRSCGQRASVFRNRYDGVLGPVHDRRQCPVVVEEHRWLTTGRALRELLAIA
jgi:hypothetical protein